MNTRVKIIIAERSLILRKGISSVLKSLPDIRVDISEISDPEQFRTQISRIKPDVLIMNPLSLRLCSLSQIRKDSGQLKIKCIALQTSLIDPSILKMFDETISLYDTEEQVREKISRLLSLREETIKYESLSAREKEVIACVIKGMTNKQIAEKLCLSTHTIITHRRNISSKLNIHSTAGLTIYAIANKMMDLDTSTSLTD